MCWPLIFTLSKQNPILLAGAAQINTRINLADVCSGKLAAPGGQTRASLFILPAIAEVRERAPDRSKSLQINAQLNSINLFIFASDCRAKGICQAANKSPCDYSQREGGSLSGGHTEIYPSAKHSRTIKFFYIPPSAIKFAS